jgi:hypothetical protein
MEEQSGDDLEFFGVKLRVNNPRLAALLNSGVNENVVVIGRRARDLIAAAEEDDDMTVACEDGASYAEAP